MKIEFLEAHKNNFCKGRKEKIDWIVMHYTGNANDTAKNNALYFKNNIVESSAHYFVDDKYIYQSVKDIDVAWHCGAKEYKHQFCRNENSIGIEMCGCTINGEICASEKTLLTAAELVSYLCNKYDISFDHIIRHFDVTGKLCPAYWINNNGLEEFKNRVIENNEEKVSIITCSYNADKYLSEAIESVLKQSYVNWELLIIDDGSIDLTKQLVEKYSKSDSRIKFFYQEHKSSSSARNVGIKKAKGRYIAFLDADDIWNSNFLESQLKFLNNSNSICVCSGYEIINEKSKSIGVKIVPKKIITKDDLSIINYVGNLTGLYDTKKYGKIYLNEELKSSLDDFLFWYDISLKEAILGNSEILAKYRIYKNTTTSNKFKTIYPHYVLYRKYLNQSVFQALKSTFIWGLFGIKKYIKIYLFKLLIK